MWAGVAGALLCAAVAAGQAKSAAQDQSLAGRLELGDLSKLEAKAKQIVDVTVDQRLIRMLATFIPNKKPEDISLREFVMGLKGIYVRSYQFDAENAYSKADVDFVRGQMKSSVWSRIVGVRSAKGENVEVYTMYEGDKMNNLVVLAAEPKSFTVVNIVGLIDFEKLRALEGRFGIPKLEIDLGGDTKPKPADPKKP
jgi:hypothetical protein